MGSDKLFHKRREKTVSDLKRRKASRSPYDRILIVCEGQKTEPSYFSSIRDHYRLNSANIEITGESESSPDRVIEYAENAYKKDKKSGSEYNRVYCIFDRDKHGTFYSAIAKLKKLKPSGVFFSITSNPCFEYWLLLHYQYTTRSFEAAGNSTACDGVIKELRNHIESYRKGDENIYHQLMNKTDIAIKHSKKSILDAEASDSDCPTTYVHELVEYLRNLQDC